MRLHEGTRVSPTQGRFGDLSGAKRPDSRGRGSLARQRSEASLDAGELLTRIARRWADELVSGDRQAVMELYAPDCIIHTRSRAEIGRKAIETSIDQNPLLGSVHHDVHIRGIGSRVLVSWPLNRDDQARVPVSEQRTQTTLRFEHGQIAEQWD